MHIDDVFNYTATNSTWETKMGKMKQIDADIKDEARKNDTGKRDLSLISLVMMEAIAEAGEVGVRKYDRYNYMRGGLTASRIFSGILRHLFLYFYKREWRCPADGQTHLGAAAFGIQMLLELHDRESLNDDRPPLSVQTSTTADQDIAPKLGREFKVGDKVYCTYHNRSGAVVEIDHSRTYPVRVALQGKSGPYHTAYYLDGRCAENKPVRLIHADQLEQGRDAG